MLEIQIHQREGIKYLLLNEKVKALALIRKGKKNPVLRSLRSMARMNLLSVKLRKREKKFMLVLLLHLKLQKLQVQCDKCLVKVEKTLRVWYYQQF
jgi:hypothetical protein